MRVLLTGAYGRTQAAGEEAMEQVLSSPGKNFALTMLRLPHQHRHPGLGLLASDHRQRAGAGAALV